MFLNVFEPSHSVEDWIGTQKRLEERYKADVAEILIDPRKEAESHDLSQAHPLSNEPDTPWAQYFERTELEKSIDLDVVRWDLFRGNDS